MYPAFGFLIGLILFYLLLAGALLVRAFWNSQWLKAASTTRHPKK